MITLIRREEEEEWLDRMPEKDVTRGHESDVGREVGGEEK